MNETAIGPRTPRLGQAVLVAALLTLCVTMVATNKRDITMVIPAWETFIRALNIALLPTVVYAAVLFLIGSLWRLDAVWKACLAALAGVLIGHTLGYIVQILANGVELNTAAWQLIATEPLGLSFPFVLTGVVIAGIVVPWFAGAGESDASSKAQAGRQPAPIAAVGSAFMRVPSDEFLDAMDEDARERADEEWEAIVSLLEAHEWGTQAISGAEHEHDSLFVADTALVLGEQVIMALPDKSDERRIYTDVRRELEGAGAYFDELEAPAQFNPADVVVGDGEVFVGMDAGTNAAAVRGLRKLLAPRGYRVIAVPVAGGMRLSEVMSVLPDGTKLVWAEAVMIPSVLGRYVAVPEPRGAATVALNSNTIAVSASAPETAQIINALGYHTKPVELDALESRGVSLTRLLLLSR